ncbi:MAG: tandem-95 repeat protein [Rhodothermales bacterium]|nr:tandem-95 repeat protein [Rhodothermales bacterium]MBO6780156.1 tandem-95 repeat protein [Rhodothermales bacterium]
MRLLRGSSSFLRCLAAALFLSIAGVSGSHAQVTVTVADVSTSVGTVVEVPVVLSGVEAGAGVNSFQLTITSSDPAVVPDRADAGSPNFHNSSGTLVQNFTVSSNDANGRIGGFTSSNNAFTGSGTLILVRLKATAAVSSTITLTDFRLNSGNPAHTPDVPSFTFDATGSGGGGSNNAPVASNVNVTTSQDTPVTVTFSATDADADNLTYSVVATPGNGTLGTVSGNTVQYTPGSGFTGTDSFTYKANDGTEDSNTATVSIVVGSTGGGNNSPIANDDSYTVGEDAALSVPAPGVLTNDTDADGNSLTASLETSPDNGSVSLASNGSFAYVPDADFSGTDTFTYVANDGTINSNTGTVTITVTAVNDAPVAQNQSVTTESNQAVTITLVATDAESDPLTYTITATPLKGSINQSGNVVVYTPNNGESGGDSFAFKANDGQEDSNNATVTITIGSLNTAPTATDDSYDVDEDDFLGVPAPGVLANDSDPNGDNLTASLVSGTSNGDISLQADGSFLYTPDADFNGTDTFVYEASDGSLADQGTVTITVNPTGTARLQVIHNAPDAQVDPADVYLNGELFLLNAPYHTASPFVSRADGTLDVVMTPNGTGMGGAVATFQTTLDENGTYVIILGGSTQSSYALNSIPNAKESTSNDRFEAFFFQGGSDLPTIDIVNQSDDLDNPGEVTVLAGATFGDFTPYLPNTPNSYNFALRTSGGSTIDVFRLALTDAGATYSVVVGGLLNSPAYPISMTAFDAAGNAKLGNVVTSIEPIDELAPKTFLLRGNYPNPFNPNTNIQFDLPEAAEVAVRVTDLLGREMLSIPAQQFSAGTNLFIPVDASELASGIYIYRVEARTVRTTHVATGTMTLIK